MLGAVAGTWMVMKIGAAKFAGKLPAMLNNASTPPAEPPITTMRCPGTIVPGLKARGLPALESVRNGRYGSDCSQVPDRRRGRVRGWDRGLHRVAKVSSAVAGPGHCFCPASGPDSRIDAFARHRPVDEIADRGHSRWHRCSSGPRVHRSPECGAIDR